MRCRTCRSKERLAVGLLMFDLADWLMELTRLGEHHVPADLVRPQRSFSVAQLECGRRRSGLAESGAFGGVERLK